MKQIILEVDIKEGVFYPSLRNFGGVIDDITDLHCKFRSGNVYGIIGECGSGGWALSYVLSGRDTCPQQKIYVNENGVSQKDLEELGWYAGDGIAKIGFFDKEKSILKQLQYGLKKNNNPFSIDEIVQKFKLSQDRLSSKMSQLSWEKWRASIAIGYAHGKKVYCFPWLNTAQVNDLILNTGFHIYLDILKEEGSIIIIPTDKKETLEFIADEYIILNNPRHSISVSTKELLAKYSHNKQNSK